MIRIAREASCKNQSTNRPTFLKTRLNLENKMPSINIEFENCYGIKQLNFKFDFSRNKAYAIYAQNGVMKTSFAKAFQDLSNEKDSEDRVFKDRKAKRIIQDEKGNAINKNQVFVIEPYNQDYKSLKISTLLVNKSLKEKYDNIHQEIDNHKELLTKELKKLSGLKDEIGEVFAEAFTHDKKQFFIALSRVKSEVAEGKESNFSDLQYQKIFNDKVYDLIKSEDFRKSLTEYINIYDQLLNASTFFKKGVFNHNNASDIAKNLKENGFFKANHSIYINAEGEKKEIKNENELTEVIQHEKESILNDPKLASSFESIDKKLSKNKDLKDFREYLASNKIILEELNNLNSFKQKLWISYLIKSKEQYHNLISSYEKGREEIDKIVQQAKNESTKWREVIEIFNDRFSVPFTVTMENQDDVILRSEAPNIKFEFKDTHGLTVPIAEDDLLKILSNGEKRALYILNIIFEAEARKEAGQETLFIIDDIADSFDYKNKYAIIEYLKDISDENNFYQIILSHNFDFYRTIASRFSLSRDHRLHAVKTDESIRILSEKYQKNPFNHWKDNLSEKQEMLIAAIPFIRNLAEYCGYTEEYEFLTALLHIKENTHQITINDLEKTIKMVLKDKHDLSVNTDKDIKVKELIYDIANTLQSKTDEPMDLENKIVLSIAIRLKTEEFLIKKINDKIFVNGIKENQTIKLIKKYKHMFPSDIKNIKLVEQVNIMTPENIHINSFMYEPILDMSDQHLKQLYSRITDLN